MSPFTFPSLRQTHPPTPLNIDNLSPFLVVQLLWIIFILWSFGLFITLTTIQHLFLSSFSFPQNVSFILTRVVTLFDVRSFSVLESSFTVSHVYILSINIWALNKKSWISTHTHELYTRRQIINENKTHSSIDFTLHTCCYCSDATRRRPEEARKLHIHAHKNVILSEIIRTI